MRYGKRSVFNTVMHSRVTLVFLIVAFLFLIKTTWNMHERAAIAEGRLDQSRVELREAKQRKEDLARKVGYLSTDEGVQSEIRSKFRAAEKGESVAVIVDDRQTANVISSNASGTSTAVSKKLSWWGRVAYFFGFR